MCMNHFNRECVFGIIVFIFLYFILTNCFFNASGRYNAKQQDEKFTSVFLVYYVSSAPHCDWLTDWFSYSLTHSLTDSVTDSTHWLTDSADQGSNTVSVTSFLFKFYNVNKLSVTNQTLAPPHSLSFSHKQTHTLPPHHPLLFLLSVSTSVNLKSHQLWKAPCFQQQKKKRCCQLLLFDLMLYESTDLLS